MTCHTHSGRIAENIPGQLNAWVYVPTHTQKHTHQALRCLERRDRAVSISLSTYPEDLISQWIHVKWRLSSTFSPTDSLPTIFSCRAPEKERERGEKRWILPYSSILNQSSHIIFSQSPVSLFYSLIVAPGYKGSNTLFPLLPFKQYFSSFPLSLLVPQG